MEQSRHKDGAFDAHARTALDHHCLACTCGLHVRGLASIDLAALRASIASWHKVSPAQTTSADANRDERGEQSKRWQRRCSWQINAIKQHWRASPGKISKPHGWQRLWSQTRAVVQRQDCGREPAWTHRDSDEKHSSSGSSPAPVPRAPREGPQGWRDEIASGRVFGLF